MADQPPATIEDFIAQCSDAQDALKRAHESLMTLWHTACDVPHPFASLLMEPLVTDLGRISQRLDVFRAVAEAFQRRHPEKP